MNIAEELVGKNSNILLLKELNEGKGSSVYYAKSHINTSHVIVHDADLEYFPSDIAKLFEISKNNPRSLIVGTRTQKELIEKKFIKLW